MCDVFWCGGEIFGLFLIFCERCSVFLEIFFWFEIILMVVFMIILIGDLLFIWL